MNLHSPRAHNNPLIPWTTSGCNILKLSGKVRSFQFRKALAGEIMPANYRSGCKTYED
jgi:hypothetical protein